MFLRRWMLVLLLLGPAWNGFAHSAERKEQRSVNVPTGRETRIAYYGSPDAKCNAGSDPQITIAETPSYGTIGFKTVRLRATPSSIPERDGFCVGKFIDVIAVYYRPTARFHGSDRVRIRVKFERSAAEAMIWEEQIFVSVR
jgi:hypothetical protein